MMHMEVFYTDHASGEILDSQNELMNEWVKMHASLISKYS